ATAGTHGRSTPTRGVDQRARQARSGYSDSQADSAEQLSCCTAKGGPRVRHTLRAARVPALCSMAATLIALSACSSASSEISDTQYRAVSVGAPENSIRSEFGTPLATDDIPQTLPTRPGEE